MRKKLAPPSNWMSEESWYGIGANHVYEEILTALRASVAAGNKAIGTQMDYDVALAIGDATDKCAKAIEGMESVRLNLKAAFPDGKLKIKIPHMWYRREDRTVSNSTNKDGQGEQTCT